MALLPGRIPRATDADRPSHTHAHAQHFFHEAAALWPATADAVSLRGLRLVARAGHDVWGRTDRAQPVALSLRVAARARFAGAAAGDALDASTVHYGVLSKNVLGALAGGAGDAGGAGSGSGSGWLSGVEVASRVSEAVVRTAAGGAVEALRLDVGFPKASTLGTGAGVEWMVFYGGDGGQVVGFARQLYVRGMAIPTLIGVNANERMKKQMCLVSVWIDKVSEGAVDGYDVVEDIVLKAVENTDFETLEALAERVAHVLFKSFIAGESSGSNLRIRIEKPTAVPLADFPAIEIYRTQDQVLYA
ncbi:folic acid synthesis protein [Diplodia corticola]|uniref:dihydroneopterin aldolase n=1 Tax=Diplodia corticola TaxID=236234 RepID=A0A1J9QVJ4_9PEZI|nr:folic acid synthesis protein [Diplodia corticola]OJD32440.1 folic acid synthesis protein [Diplodia corticola]